MADMQRMESTEIACSLPDPVKRATIKDLSICWSRIGDRIGLPSDPESPRTTSVSVGTPRSTATRSHLNNAQEHVVDLNARSRVLYKISSHRQKSGQVVNCQPPPARSRTISVHSQHYISQVVGQRVLTPRELEVLRLVAHGETDRGIAERLYLSRRTVSCHVSNILDKLNVESRRKAVLTAMRIGLL